MRKSAALRPERSERGPGGTPWQASEPASAFLAAKTREGSSGFWLPRTLLAGARGGISGRRVTAGAWLVKGRSSEGPEGRGPRDSGIRVTAGGVVIGLRAPCGTRCTTKVVEPAQDVEKNLTFRSFAGRSSGPGERTRRGAGVGPAAAPEEGPAGRCEGPAGPGVASGERAASRPRGLPRGRLLTCCSRRSLGRSPTSSLPDRSLGFSSESP
jgi:hypothetical protein